MATSELLKYVREQLAAGYFHADIVAMLKRHGWSDADIDQAMGILRPVSSLRPEAKTAAFGTGREESRPLPAPSPVPPRPAAIPIDEQRPAPKGPDAPPPPLPREPQRSVELRGGASLGIPSRSARLPAAGGQAPAEALLPPGHREAEKEPARRAAALRPAPAAKLSPPPRAPSRTALPQGESEGHPHVFSPRPPARRGGPVLLSIEIFFLALAALSGAAYFFTGYRAPIDRFVERLAAAAGPSAPSPEGGASAAAAGLPSTAATSTIIAALQSVRHFGSLIDADSILIDRPRGNFFFSVHPSQDVAADLYRYDFERGNLVKMASDDNLSVFSLSPNGAYAVLDSGTDASSRGRDVFDVEKNAYLLRAVTNGAYAGDPVAWTSDSGKYALSLGGYDVSGALCASGGALSSLYVENATSTVLSRPLYAATAAAGYSAVRWIDGETLLVKRNAYRAAFPRGGVSSRSSCASTRWQDIFNHPSVEYLTRNVVTGAAAAVPPSAAESAAPR